MKGEIDMNHTLEIQLPENIYEYLIKSYRSIERNTGNRMVG